MKELLKSFAAGAVILIVLFLTGCESTEKGGTSAASYNNGFDDPWLYGDAIYNDGVVVGPPPTDRPTPPGDQPRPEHPIALPPSGAGGPRPTPMPSIPSTPMATPRGGRR
jgi:hypothetical protein